MNKLDSAIVLVAIVLVAMILFRYSRLTRAGVAASPASVGVDELIRTLSEELQDNEERLRSRGAAGLFRVEKAEVEIAFVLKATESKTGQVAVKPVAVTLGEEYSKEVQHRVKVILQPLPSRRGKTAPVGEEKKE